VKLVLSGVSWFVSLEHGQTFTGKRAFYEWFVMALCVVSDFEQSPRQASLAKSSLFIGRFWEKLFSPLKTVSSDLLRTSRFPASETVRTKKRPKPQNQTQKKNNDHAESIFETR
jgi:hypothetical protein